jgi:hypothetical protein
VPTIEPIAMVRKKAAVVLEDIEALVAAIPRKSDDHRRKPDRQRQTPS